MKFFITGSEGQLGYDLICRLQTEGKSVVGSDILPESAICRQYVRLDITDENAVSAVLHSCLPDVVIHCAAWTAVDAAEDPEKQEKAWRINAEGTKNLARACRDIQCKMLYISTDYVFDGSGDTPWKPDCREYAPLNYYGKSKLAGELAVAETVDRFFIVRIAWVFGSHGNNFVKTMLRLGKTLPELRVVNDQIGTPTYTRDLARLLIDVCETESYGYYHATNEGGYISWYDFAEEIMLQAELPSKVIPVSTEAYGLSKAARPYNSRLDRTKLVQQGFAPLPDWKDALHRYLLEIGEIK